MTDDVDDITSPREAAMARPVARHGDPRYDPTHEMDRDVLPTGELPVLERDEPTTKRRLRPIRFTLKVLAFVVLGYFLLPPVLSGFEQAVETIRDVNPALIVLGFVLQILSLLCYSLLTRSALGTAGRGLSTARVFRIQLSTKALSNIVPGGNAAGSALGYRLLTLSGISGPHAGFALATAGIGSAVVLNIVFWTGLVASMPFRRVNAGYGMAALAGIIILAFAAMLVIGVMDGSGRAERLLRWIARKLHLDEDKFAAVLHQVAARLEELASDRHLLRRVVFWALLNWLLDAASLWVFLKAYGGELSVDALLVAFGLANLLAAIPILPGGLGVVEATYLTTLVGFGIPRRVVAPAIATYRTAQYLMPIALGALAYASLRVGPWKIEKRDRLVRLRDLARTEAAKGESRLDFALRFPGPRPIDGPIVDDSDLLDEPGDVEGAGITEPVLTASATAVDKAGKDEGGDLDRDMDGHPDADENDDEDPRGHA